MLDQALGPNLISRLSGSFASIKQDCLPTYQVDQGWPWGNQFFHENFHNTKLYQLTKYQDQNFTLPDIKQSVLLKSGLGT